MNHQMLTEIEIYRKIFLFQKAVEHHTKNDTAKNFQAAENVKRELVKFAMKVKL
jgi:hypothetical protein